MAQGLDKLKDVFAFATTEGRGSRLIIKHLEPMFQVWVMGVLENQTTVS